MILTVHATKGGQGTSTVAAALAILNANARRRTLLVDTSHDLAAILATPETNGPGLADYLRAVDVTLGDVTTNVADRLDLINRGTGPIRFDTHTYGLLTSGLGTYDTVIIDAATHAPEWTIHAERTVLVTRPCYLALRRSTDLARRPDHIVFIAEPSRALDATDIETVTGAHITATIPFDPAIARTIDAGLLAARLPRTISRALRPLINIASLTR